MIASQTDHIYTVENNSWISYSDDRQLDILSQDAEQIVAQPSKGVRAMNVRNSDVISVQTFMDGEGYEVTIPYLVVFATAGAGLLIPCTTVENNPKAWTTDRLRFLVQSLEYGEFEQFGLPLTTSYIRQQSAY